MFGQDENTVHDDSTTAPMPDGALTQNDMQQGGMPASLPPADHTMTNYMADDSQDTAAAPTGTDDGLLSIKQQALQQLSPLLGHLNQSPEERFRTTMMMIQASDNESLIKTAYEAAQQITDEKVRAQALLDVVNEINYFTQHPED